MADMDKALALSIASACHRHAESLNAIYRQHPDPHVLAHIHLYHTSARRFWAQAHGWHAQLAPRVASPPRARRAVGASRRAAEAAPSGIFSSVEPYQSPPLESISLRAAPRAVADAVGDLTVEEFLPMGRDHPNAFSMA